MNNKIIIEIDTLTAEEFIALSKSVNWGVNRTYDMPQVNKALKSSTMTVVARDEAGEAVGCGRVFSDDFLMTFIPDVFVNPNYQKLGIGKRIVEKMKESYGHTSFFFGAQPGNQGFFEKLGFEKSIQSYAGRFKESPFYK
jgi:predicted N-acetyltransferase YhbS